MKTSNMLTSGAARWTWAPVYIFLLLYDLRWFESHPFMYFVKTHFVTVTNSGEAAIYSSNKYDILALVEL